MTEINKQHEREELNLPTDDEGEQAFLEAYDPTTRPRRLEELTHHDNLLTRYGAWTNPNLGSHEDCNHDEDDCLTEVSLKRIGVCDQDAIEVLLDFDKYSAVVLEFEDGSSSGLVSRAMGSVHSRVRAIAGVYAWDYLSDEERAYALTNQATLRQMTSECEWVLGQRYEEPRSFEDLLATLDRVTGMWSDCYREYVSEDPFDVGETYEFFWEMSRMNDDLDD